MIDYPAFPSFAHQEGNPQCPCNECRSTREEAMAIDERTPLREELAALINRHSLENGSNTPDFILAEYLLGCLGAFDKAARERTHWYGHAVRENDVLECNVPGLPNQPNA